MYRFAGACTDEEREQQSHATGVKCGYSVYSMYVIVTATVISDLRRLKSNQRRLTYRIPTEAIKQRPTVFWYLAIPADPPICDEL